MRGQILGVDLRSGEGQLSGMDGRRYRFSPDDWAHRGGPAIGLEVDFEPEEGRARSIFPVPVSVPVPVAEVAPPVPRGGRNKHVAALLAFFLGTLGIHRFYLGRARSAVVMLVLTCTIVGLAITGLWALIDTVRYLFMSDEEFARRYPRRVRP